MILDLLRDELPEHMSADICIVGSGAAGMAAAFELTKTKLKVLILESGDIKYNDDTQSLYNSEIVGHSFNGAHEGRFRTLGGSTTKWGGQALPLTEFDFIKRSWVSYSGWPINYTDIIPYYKKATDYLLVDNYNFTDDLFDKLKISPPGFDKSLINYHLSKWSPVPNLRKIYLPIIKKSKNVTLIKNANLIKINLGEKLNNVSDFKFVTINKCNKLTVTAANYILATGGIEVARILLSNQHQLRCGIGNEEDLVGRFLQDHPVAHIGVLKTENPRQIQKLFNVHFYKGKKYSVRFSLSSSVQQSLQLLNASAAINFNFNKNSVFNNLSYLKTAIRDKEKRRLLSYNIIEVIKKSPSLTLPIYYYLFKNRIVKPNTDFNISIMTEQEPDPESRIQLSTQKDSLGIPKSKITWKVNASVWKTVNAFAHIIKEQFHISELGNVLISENINLDIPHWEDFISDQYHHIGTTRMDNSSKYGVVDKHCRIHNINNLYIASSSVFPTSGHSNPTLTLIALTFRIIDKINNPSINL
ncbi:MAG: family oxidoreductase [Chitinophagaceae bacterium]|nr:family oxidoreductase [Chitinophagaceae bacterium]